MHKCGASTDSFARAIRRSSACAALFDRANDVIAFSIVSRPNDVHAAEAVESRRMGSRTEETAAGVMHEPLHPRPGQLHAAEGIAGGDANVIDDKAATQEKAIERKTQSNERCQADRKRDRHAQAFGNAHKSNDAATQQNDANGQDTVPQALSGWMGLPGERR